MLKGLNDLSLGVRNQKQITEEKGKTGDEKVPSFFLQREKCRGRGRKEQKSMMTFANFSLS